MEPVTHFLTGACMGRAGLNRKTALATAVMTLGAEAADIDVIGYVRGSAYGFAHHRGITHSLVGVPFVAAFVVGFVYVLHRLGQRWRPKQQTLPPRWGLLFWGACVAGLSHILLDFTTNYGVRPFTPFHPRWYSWDIVFIVEPVLLVILIAGLALPSFFGMISDEVGARRKGPRGQLGAILALVGMVLVWGVRDYEHRRAVAALEARDYEGAVPLRAGASPYWLSPFKWAGVVETKNFFESMNVNSTTGDVNYDDRGQIWYKPEETPVTIAAKKSFLGRVYLDWARFPITETEQLDSPPGYVVRFYDLRFMYPDRRGSTPLSAVVLLDQNLDVLVQRMGARGLPKARGGSAGRP